MAERPLRILQILRAPVGGLFRHVSDLTAELSSRGHRIGIAVDSLSADGLTAERLHRLRPHAVLGIHSFPMPRVFGIGDLTTPAAIRRLAQELAIDVLHGHGAKGGFHARLARIGSSRRAALYTPHGGVLHFNPHSPSGVLFQALERLLLPATDAVVFESRFAQDAFQRIIGHPKCPDPVIHNGLAASEFEPVTPQPDAHDFVFIGEFRRLKGIDVLLDAIIDLKAPDGRPATLVMAGDGPDFDRFKAELEKRGLADRVTLVGVRPARAVLPQGRCSIVPSLAESLPYVVMEAAAAGVPVIATRVGGIAEIFGPTAAALVPPDDVPALRAAMQRALDDPGAALREAAQRLDHVRAAFSVGRMAGQVEDLYRQALATRKALARG